MCFDACELLKIQLLFFIQPQSIYAIHYSHTFIFTAITANITAITARIILVCYQMQIYKKITDGISLPPFLSQKTLFATFYAQCPHRLYSIPPPVRNPLNANGFAKGHLLAAKRWPFTLQKTTFRIAVCRLSGFIRKPVGWLLKVIPFMSCCKSCCR